MAEPHPAYLGERGRNGDGRGDENAFEFESNEKQDDREEIEKKFHD